jgi:hypothetical protein
VPQKNLDELMGVVEGEMITRRMLMREVGPRATDQEEREYEARLRTALLRRAEARIFYKAAERTQLSLTPDMIEDAVKDESRRILLQAREAAEKVKKGSGASITLERWLVERGLSMEEFRADVAKRLMRYQYFRVLERGVPGKRAVVDLEPSPEDVRRLYAAHRGDFDVQPGVRFAFFALRPVDLLAEGSRLTWDQAKAQTRARAEAVLRDFARDRDADRAAAAAGILRGDYVARPAGEFLERAQMRQSDAVVDWLFAPERKAGETTVVELPKGDVYALAVLEVRPARTRTFDEVQPDLMERIRIVRRLRFELQHTLELLGRAQIWPSRLAEALQDRERAELKKLDEDAVAKDIRLR